MSQVYWKSRTYFSVLLTKSFQQSPCPLAMVWNTNGMPWWCHCLWWKSTS